MHLKIKTSFLIIIVFICEGFSSNIGFDSKIKNNPLLENIEFKRDTLNTQKNDSVKKVTFGGSNFISTRFIARTGAQLGKGLVNQTFFKIQHSKFTAWAWANYGLEEGAFQEVDFGIEYRDILVKKFLGGKLDFMFGLTNFNFPTLDISNLLLEGMISYQGFIEVDVVSTTVLENKKVDTGSRIYTEIRKPFPIKIGSLKTTLIPTISGTYHWDFYGFDKEAHISPEIKYKLHFSKFAISTFLKYQISSDDIVTADGKKNPVYGGLGIVF
jgi:hypothetical protein